MKINLIILWNLYLGMQILLSSFLIQPFVLFLLYLPKKLFPSRRKDKTVQAIYKNYQFGIIITAHRETSFIPPIIDSLIKQTYPHFNVYVVADDCETDGLLFGDLRINILKPPIALNTNSKSIQFAIKHFKDTDEIVVIFDPDNLVHPAFLEVLNGFYNKGFKAVQGNLHSKNSGNIYEKIDSVGMIFNKFIDREIRSMLGLSVNIWGCGISVERSIYEKITYESKSHMGGFDKGMQIGIVKNVSRIAYAPDAILYDEKISDGENLEKQRIRWISSYFKFLKEAIGLLMTGFRRGDLNLVYFGYNLIRAPYFLLILTALFFFVLNLFVSPGLSIAWIVILSVFILSFILIVTINTTDKKVSKGIWYMPLFFYHQIRSLSKLKMNKKSILKTSHSKIVYIDDLLKHEPS